MSRRRPSRYLTLAHQFSLAEESLSEAENHLATGWYSSSITHSFQVVHRAAAGLLFARQAKVFTEKEVRYGFSAQFVVPGLAQPTTLADYDRLDSMRLVAEREYDYTATHQEASEALALARAFWESARSLSKPLIENPSMGG